MMRLSVQLAAQTQPVSMHIEPFELVLLGAAAALTLGMMGFFVFMLARKEKQREEQ